MVAEEDEEGVGLLLLFAADVGVVLLVVVVLDGSGCERGSFRGAVVTAMSGVGGVYGGGVAPGGGG